MRHMLQALLGKHGYGADVAVDGADGLQCIGRSPYDFILCDLKMPVMDGTTFSSRSCSGNCTSTIIMMSAYGTVDQAIETVKMGAYDYISKPFKLEEILLVLRQGGRAGKITAVKIKTFVRTWTKSKGCVRLAAWSAGARRCSRFSRCRKRWPPTIQPY